MKTSFITAMDSEYSQQIIVIVSIAFMGFSFLVTLSDLIGWKYLLIGLGVLVIVLGACWYLDSMDREAASHIVTEESMFSIVSREDFVDQYIGWTDKKTKRLLNANRGKVLFIDEAYSLVINSHDQYGLEAATTLNKFMSEHPDEIIVIFAGYKDELQKGLFRYQPGLSRRCMWHFEIQPYDYKQLFDIFTLQLKKESYTLKHPNKSIKLFHEYYNVFVSYAGDTERLCNFVILQYISDEGSEQLITADQLRRGILVLKENNIAAVPRERMTFSNIYEALGI
jgi:hypothetical protein